MEPLFGFDHWLDLFQIFTIITMAIIITVYVVAWRRHGAHPVLLMGIITTLIVWQDPIMNWSPFAVYNPQLWHWPEDWPLEALRKSAVMQRYSLLNSSTGLNGAPVAFQAIVEFNPPPGMRSNGKPEPTSS